MRVCPQVEPGSGAFRLVLCAGRVGARRCRRQELPSGALCSVGSRAWGIGCRGWKGTGAAQGAVKPG